MVNCIAALEANLEIHDPQIKTEFQHQNTKYEIVDYDKLADQVKNPFTNTDNSTVIINAA